MSVVIGEIYSESDYSKFKRLSDNRDVLSRRLTKLIASISEKYILNPIVVNENMEIIDGQGRFEALKALGLPIIYVIAKNADSNDCRRMNKYNTTWSTLDFARSYAKAQKKSYQLLLVACKETGLSITRVLRITNHGSRHSLHGDNMSSFEKGDLQFSEKDVETAKTISTCANEIQQALMFTGRTNDAFYNAVEVAYNTEGYDHQRMLKNCTSCRASYAQMSRLSDQLKEFERIYNYRSKASGKIYFSDYMRNRGSSVRDYTTTYSPYNDADISSLKKTPEGVN